VFTDNERIRQDRKIILELLLSRAPQVSVLQELAREYGVGKPRFKPDNKDCILCGLCVRVCSERLGIGAIGFTGRGTIRGVGIPFGDENSDRCIACGACTYVCPTGAIQMEARTLQRFLQLEGEQRRCRYMMMGVAGYKLCSHNYECWNCEVEQKIMEEFGKHPALAIAGPSEDATAQVEGFLQNPGLFYFRNHVWMKPLNGIMRLGIDDFAVRLFGRIDEVIVPEKSQEVSVGGDFCVICSGDRHVALTAPIAGRVVDVNPEVLDYPELVDIDPYGRGWLLTFEPKDKNDVQKNALTRFRAREWLNRDVDKLRRRLQRTPGIETFKSEELAALVAGKLSDADWKALAETFLMR
jgi:glycine cleavage system H lipoate-binding protein/NAD-dependent dihydropyrimidine dehydrogenase PreA subunit